MLNRTSRSITVARECLLWLLAWSCAFGFTRHLAMAGYWFGPHFDDCGTGRSRASAILSHLPFREVVSLFAENSTRAFLLGWLAVAFTVSTVARIAGDPEPLRAGLLPLRGRWLDYAVILLAAGVAIVTIGGFPGESRLPFVGLGLLFLAATQFSRKMAVLRYLPAYWAFQLRTWRLGRANAAASLRDLLAARPHEL
jgi:hypothetical protein